MAFPIDRPVHARCGGIFSLIGVIVVLLIGIAIGIYYVAGKEGLAQEAEKIERKVSGGQRAVSFDSMAAGRILSVKNGEAIKQDTYALVKFSVPSEQPIPPATRVHIMREKQLIAEGIIESRAESGNYVVKVLPGSWTLPAEQRQITADDLVVLVK